MFGLTWSSLFALVLSIAWPAAIYFRLLPLPMSTTDTYFFLTNGILPVALFWLYRLLVHGVPHSNRI